MATRQQGNHAKGSLGTLKQYVSEFNFQANNPSKKWKSWIKNFEICVKLEQVPEKDWLKLLLVLGGEELRDKIEKIEIQTENYNDYKKELNEYFTEKKSLNVLRHKLLNTEPENGESTRAWMERCTEIANDCEFETFTKKDALLLNLCQYTKLPKLRNEILIKDLKYDEAIKFAQTLEMAEKDAKELAPKTENDYDINAIKRPGPYSNKFRKQTTVTTENKTRLCGRCGKYEPHDCAARDQICYKCNKKGHFARKCRSKNINITEEKSDDEIE